MRITWGSFLDVASKSDSKPDWPFDEIDDKMGSSLTSLILIRLVIIGGRKKNGKAFATAEPSWRGEHSAPQKAYTLNAESKFPTPK